MGYVNTTFVDIMPNPFLGASGYRYDVRLGDETIVTRSKSPLCDAARALVNRGVAGRVVMRRSGQPIMQALIAVAATLVATEGASSGPRFANWQPHFMAGGDDE